MTVKQIMINTFTIAVAAVLLSACATYTIPREQLYSMLKNATPDTVTTKHAATGTIGITGAMYTGDKYLSNGVKTIACYDKQGSEVTFANSPKVEMRITTNNGRKHIFYFDSVILQDSTFRGYNSRIFRTKISVKYADIKKVEVQKGAKAYYYAGSK